MRTITVVTMVVGLGALASCKPAEPSTAAAIRSDYAGHMGRSLRVSGQVVRPSSTVRYVWVGAANYFTLEDETGRLNIWYGVGMRCAPRIGSEVSVTGKVIKPEQSSIHIFSARRVSIESSPPLAEDEVRLCELSNREIEVYETQGREALEEYWRSRGRPVKRVVVN